MTNQLYRTLQCRSYQFYRDYYYNYGAAEDFGTARLKISKFRFLNLDF